MLSEQEQHNALTWERVGTARRINLRLYAQLVIEDDEPMQLYLVQRTVCAFEFTLFQQLTPDRFVTTYLEELHDILQTVTIADALLIE